MLVLHASNSVQVFRGVLEDFSQLNPGVRLEYTELSTQALYAEVAARAARRRARRPAPTWSSAAPWTCRPSWSTTAMRSRTCRRTPAPCPPGPTGATKSSASAPTPS
ncbi:hypothetical protein WJ972_31930 [Achromobacter insuavis]